MEEATRPHPLQCYADLMLAISRGEIPALRGIAERAKPKALAGVLAFVTGTKSDEAARTQAVLEDTLTAAKAVGWEWHPSTPQDPPAARDPNVVQHLHDVLTVADEVLGVPDQYKTLQLALCWLLMHPCGLEVSKLHVDLYNQLRAIGALHRLDADMGPPPVVAEAEKALETISKIDRLLDDASSVGTYQAVCNLELKAAQQRETLSVIHKLITGEDAPEHWTHNTVLVAVCKFVGESKRLNAEAAEIIRKHAETPVTPAGYGYESGDEQLPSAGPVMAEAVSGDNA